MQRYALITCVPRTSPINHPRSIPFIVRFAHSRVLAILHLPHLTPRRGTRDACTNLAGRDGSNESSNSEIEGESCRTIETRKKRTCNRARIQVSGKTRPLSYERGKTKISMTARRKVARIVQARRRAFSSLERGRTYYSYDTLRASLT